MSLYKIAIVVIILVIVAVLSMDVHAFATKRCTYENQVKPELNQEEIIRLLPENTQGAPCTVEVEKVVKGTKIKYVLYASIQSFEKCEAAATKELMSLYAKDFSCTE